MPSYSAGGLCHRQHSSAAGCFWSSVVAMDAFWQDVRYAVRRLRKHPGVSMAAIVTVGLAIGTAAIVFSALDALVLRPPPFRDPATLVQAEYLSGDGETTSASVRRNEVDFWAGQRQLFSAFEGYYLENLTAFGTGVARTITVVRVTDGLMTMLGVDAALGRYIVAGDGGATEGPPAIVLSHGLWQSGFGGDPAIVGRVVRFAATPHTVVGPRSDSRSRPCRRGLAFLQRPRRRTRVPRSTDRSRALPPASAPRWRPSGWISFERTIRSSWGLPAAGRTSSSSDRGRCNREPVKCCGCCSARSDCSWSWRQPMSRT